MQPLLSFLRGLCLVLLALGVVIRPVLIARCELHAFQFAHASRPHEHVHAHAGEDGGEQAPLDGSEHGEHDALHLGTLSDAANIAPALLLPAQVRLAQAIPQSSSPALLKLRLGVPFRPPIG